MTGRMPWVGVGVGGKFGMTVGVDAEGPVVGLPAAPGVVVGNGVGAPVVGFWVWGRREGMGVGPAVVTAMLPSSALFKFLKLGDPSPDAGSLRCVVGATRQRER